MDLRKNMEGKGKRIGLEYNHQIDAANERIKNGECYTQEEVEKMARNGNQTIYFGCRVSIW